MCKLFLILCSTVMLLSSCSSFQALDDSTSIYHHPGFYTGQDFPLNSRSINLFDFYKEQSNKDLKKLYCNGTKPLRSPTLSITVVLPKIKPGIPIDKATVLRSESVTKAEELVTQIFQEISINEVANSEVDNNYGSDFKHFYGIQSYQQSDEELFYTQSFKEVIFNSSDRFYIVIQSRNHSNQLFVVGKDSNLIQRFDDVRKNDGLMWSPTDKNKVNEAISSPNKPDHSFFSTLTEIEISDSLLPVSGSSSKVFQLASSYSNEIKSLIDNFTFLYSKEFVEKSIIASGKAECSDYSCFAIDPESGENTISKALDMKNQMWKSYFNLFTRVKASQTTIPNIKKYSVTLDTTPFCQYGRNISDLISQ